MGDFYFEGDPATDSTRRRLERVLKEESRPRWPWLAALAAGGTAYLWWQVRKRRRNGGSAEPNNPPNGPSSADQIERGGRETKRR
ncbi:MAG TPA: hypothetical protein VFO14_02385 [Vicinamibacterales bacterium]|nr:hypothetical protein [Vicinamibacterales bacterium]